MCIANTRTLIGNRTVVEKDTKSVRCSVFGKMSETDQGLSAGLQIHAAYPQPSPIPQQLLLTLDNLIADGVGPAARAALLTHTRHSA
ncbi:hypothetical protein OG322_04965 [Streptomyces sp. NBC_01260]|uniref:hypothetical protein n=1 Tax=unclassified Streptomyces TaxID=2593676 RepID=UPI000FBCF2CF|nr:MULTISPECIES: hypothetical protein [unclassified Streptomyces]MCX4768778.1 hypothetical protein [Streptomyces sp. NBC_01285]ROQ77088.1 hypothetical protein EDD95_3585 [Streptomyces sp. CEV 2-1]RPK40596.1 hypothetical protein EES39_24440 [Streptomyces sp. ADI92-24]